MTIRAPILDDRTFQQLKDDLVRRIPVYTPEWTNHNESDPGIALLELFSFLGESLLFRFNQLPERTKSAFLDLLQISPRPPEPAHALVVAETAEPTGVQIRRGAEMKAGDVSFETENEVYVWPLEVTALGKVGPIEADDDEELELDRADIARRQDVADPSLVLLYHPTVVPPDPTAPDAEPLDVSGTVDESLWIALLATDTTDIRALRGRNVFVGLELDSTLPDEPPFDLATLDDATTAGFRCRCNDAGPATLWQLWKREPNDEGKPTFEAVTVAGDTTRGLTQSGVVTITLPSGFEAMDRTIAPSGGADSPPPVDDADQARRIVGWLRVRRPPEENDAIRPVRWVGINAVGVLQARTAPLELLGIGTGDTDQRLRLRNPGVLPGTLVLEVDEVGGWRSWEEVETFVGDGPDDRHFLVDRASGEVRFGVRGRLPQIGERIRARTYRYGGGIKGRVGPGAITRVTEIGGVKVTNPIGAFGGRDPERLDEALERIPAELSRRDRAVTEADFEALTLEVTGVVRAEALACFHPDVPNVVAAGVVTVVVFPTEDRRHPATPTPDHTLLREVCRHLDQRRLITTELYVVPPTYRRVAVAVGIAVRDGYQVDAVRRWVELIVRQYLAPVPRHGPDGQGWPMGRAVRRQELEAVAVQVEGVEYVVGLEVAEETAGAWIPSDTIELERWEVPVVVEITVVEGDPLDAGDPYEPPASVDDPPIAPIPRDVC